MSSQSDRPGAVARTSLLPEGVGRRPEGEELAWRGRVGAGEPALGSDAWWAEVADIGTPLWCPDGLSDARGRPSGVPTLVFLHRDASGRGAFLDLVGLTDRSDLDSGTMRRLPGTDVLVAAFGVEPGFVASYGVVVVDGDLRSPGERDSAEARRWWLGVLAGSEPDPRAWVRRRVVRQGVVRSVARVPDGRPAAATARRGGALDGVLAPGADAVALGDGAREDVLQAITWARPDGVEQPAWLYAPPSTTIGDGAGEVGLVVLFDGRPWCGPMPVAPILDALHAAGQIPPTAAVLLDAMGPDRREADLARDAGYADLLADDLLPRVVAPALSEHGLTLSGDPARTVVAGQSYGGLAAFRAAARRPERFGASVSQSGSLWWADGEVARWLRSAAPRTVRTVLQVGAYEGPITSANAQVAALVRERGEHLVHTVVPGGHDWAWWWERLGAGLVAVLGDAGD